jgi:hypothetical protein
MRVVSKTVEELAQVLVNERVIGDVSCESVVLRLGGQLTMPQEPRYLEEARLIGQLLYRVPSILQDSAVTVDIRYSAATGSRVKKSRVVAQNPEVVGMLLY